MNANGNAGNGHEVPVININMTGNAQLSLVAPVSYTDNHSISSASVNAEKQSEKEPIWKNTLFWTALAALAGVASAICVYL